MSLENKPLKEKISILVNYYQIKDFDKLIAEANRALKKNPNIDFLWNLLGLTYQQLGNYSDAQKKFLRALQVNSNNMSAINNLGNNYKYQNNFEEAENYLKKALDKNPKYIPALINLGTLKFGFNKFEEALTYLKKAVEVDDKLHAVHLNLSLIYQSLGQFEKAIVHLKKINQLKPEFTKSDKMQSVLINYKSENSHLSLMEDKLKKLSLKDDEKIQLYFALAKAYEDKSNFSKAFNCLESGNKLKRAQSDYTINKEKKLFKDIKDLFINHEFNTIDFKQSNKNIIFILGMPRSGTTLVEQIISSHNNVFGAGEIGYLSKLIYDNFFDKNNINLVNSLINNNSTNLRNLAEKYYSYIKNFDFEQSYITDKALLNFQWIGFIRILFPNAKIINCLRNPKDNCLSIYKNLFDHEGPWCYDKRELTEFYKLYMDLMNFWKEKYPNSIYDVQYENLVLDSDKQIKELISYLNIPWDESCLKFYQNKNPIKTLSVNQARRKIYTSSLSLYEKYKPFLKESFE